MSSIRWSAHRATIIDLYLEQELPLDTVMKMMQMEHNFTASKRMYKIILKKWGITKYQRHPPCCRGKPLSTCPNCGKKRPGSYGVVARTNPAYTKQQLPAPVFLLNTPGSLRVPEECMLNIRNYVAGGFSTGLWARNTSSFSSPDTEAWRNGFASAMDTIITGNRMTRTFRVLQGLFDQLPRMLREQHPRLITALCLGALASVKIAPELYSQLVRQVSSLARIILPDQHPLRLFLQGWERMSHKQFLHCARSIIEFHFTCLETNFGPSPDCIQGITGHRSGAYLIFSNRGLMDLDVAEYEYNKLFKIFETLPDENLAERRKVTAKLSLMAAFEQSNKFDKVEQIAQEVMESKQVSENPEIALHATCVLMLAVKSQNRPDAVLQRAGEVVSICENSIPPPPRNLIMIAMQEIDRSLRAVGLDEEAERISKKLEALIDTVINSNST